MLILFTCLPAFLIVGFWPDRLPEPDEFIKPLYCNKLFHVRLVGVVDSTNLKKAASLIRKNELSNSSTADSSVDDSEKSKIGINKEQPSLAYIDSCYGPDQEYLHINTLLLLLIALAGFLGNMIHVATSFTTYVGAKTFVRSWLLWYFVKPFSAAALAIGIYFVFRGGFLNMGDGAVNINLYGVMTISILSGLFTDRATQKLKEVFEVLFKPAEKRPDPLNGPKVTDISPTEIEKGKENILKLIGENLDAKITASINEEPIAITEIAKKSAVIRYTIPDTQKDAVAFVVRIKDKDGNIVGTGNLTLKQDAEDNPE